MSSYNEYQKLEQELNKKEQKSLIRKLETIQSKRRGYIKINGKELADFSSNDYLGLSNHEALIRSSKKALDKWGCGSGASRLMSGDLKVFHDLEKKLSEHSGKEAALLFGCGYMANIGIISSLMSRKDCIFADKLVHASILDGIQLSRAKLFRFNHNDLEHLEFLLKSQRHKFNKALIIVESIYSMDGDTAPLNQLALLKEKYNAFFMVDEAHAVGILGIKGRGLIEASLRKSVDIIVGTFGKAYGSYGAYAASNLILKKTLINQARPFIFSTGLPPHVVRANLEAVKIVENMDSDREKVANLSNTFRKILQEKSNLSCIGAHHIIPVIVGSSEKALELQHRLNQSGFYVKAIRPPTVPKNSARLRVSITANHSLQTVTALAEAIIKHALEIY